MALTSEGDTNAQPVLTHLTHKKGLPAETVSLVRNSNDPGYMILKVPDTQFPNSRKIRSSKLKG